MSLSEFGTHQCRQLAQRIEHFHVQAVYSSPLSRALHSAQLIFPKHDIKIEKGLIEFNYGEYEGTVAIALKEDPVIAQWNSFPKNLTFPKGDNVVAHAKKTLNSLTSIAKSSEEKILACVTHRTTIRLIVAQVIGIDLDRFRPIPCSNCGVTELKYDEKAGFALSSLNVTMEYFGKM